jgi:hypothetical protein
VNASRPELPPPVLDEEMTMMMPSKAASALPPPPDPRAARIPRQWSPVDQLVGPPPVQVQPTLPSLSVPRALHSSLPPAPSSLAGMSVSASDTTARVRTGGALGKIARPTLSWAAALVALGIFVGIGSAVVSRSESVRTKLGLAPAERTETDVKEEKAPKLASAGPAANTNAPSNASASAKYSTPPPPLTPPPLPAAQPDETAQARASEASAPTHAPAPVMPKPRAVHRPPAHAAPLGPEARDALELAARAAAKANARPKNEASATNGGASSSSSASSASSSASSASGPSSPAAKSAKQKEIDLSKQAADLAAEQMKSLL